MKIYRICKDVILSDGTIKETPTDIVGTFRELIDKIQQLQENLEKNSGVWYHIIEVGEE